MRHKEDEEYSVELVSPCGDVIEVWEPVPQLTSWCDTCYEYHVYEPVE